MQDQDRDDRFPQWFGRRVLTATAEDIDGFYHANPDSLELAARVRAENLRGKALARVRAEIRALPYAMDDAVPDAEPTLLSLAAD